MGFICIPWGFGFLYPALMAAFIFGGSLEFVVVTMLMSPFAPLDAFVMALMVQNRNRVRKRFLKSLPCPAFPFLLQSYPLFRHKQYYIILSAFISSFNAWAENT